jgi:hypothetical protein
MSICITLQPALYSSCDTLVNPDGTLSAEGQCALGCIRNGAMLAGGAGLLGVPVSIIGKGLSLLSAPTGAGGMVKMDEINNVANSMGGLGALYTLYHKRPIMSNPQLNSEMRKGVNCKLYRLQSRRTGSVLKEP